MNAAFKLFCVALFQNANHFCRITFWLKNLFAVYWLCPRSSLFFFTMTCLVAGTYKFAFLSLRRYTIVWSLLCPRKNGTTFNFTAFSVCFSAWLHAAGDVAAQLWHSPPRFLRVCHSLARRCFLRNAIVLLATLALPGFLFLFPFMTFLLDCAIQKRNEKALPLPAVLAKLRHIAAPLKELPKWDSRRPLGRVHFIVSNVNACRILQTALPDSMPIGYGK